MSIQNTSLFDDYHAARKHYRHLTGADPLDTTRSDKWAVEIRELAELCKDCKAPDLQIIAELPSETHIRENAGSECHTEQSEALESVE
jgi:hypothetical protein